MPRFFVPLPLHTGLAFELPPEAARHVQVLRFQPGDALTLFNGEGGAFAAQVLRMGKGSVGVQVGAHSATEREATRALHLLVGLMANERFDWLVEKATELGVTSIQPLMTERSVLRLAGERADKKLQHWRGIAQAACEQSGRNRLPLIAPVRSFTDWARGAATDAGGLHLLLSLQADAQPLPALAAGHYTLHVLSGPEGGLSPQEEQAAMALGWQPASLGPRTLRAETAAIAASALLCT